MAGLMSYALAGAAGGLGEGMVARAKALREEALLAMKRQWDREDAQQEHEWRMEEADARAGRRGGGGGGGRRGSGGGGSDTSSVEGYGEPVFSTASGAAGSTGGGSGGGLMPRDPMALTKPGEAPPDEYDTYGYDAPAPAADAAPAPAAPEVDPNLPRPAKKGEKLVNRFEAEDGSWRAFSAKTNEEVLLTPPTGGKGGKPSDSPPFLSKPAQESADLPRPERTEKIEIEKELPQPPERRGLMPKAPARPGADEPPAEIEGAPEVVPNKPAKPVELSASSRGRLERSFRDKTGRDMDPAMLNRIVMEIEALMGEGQTEAQATADVTSRLTREERVTNPAGTAFSRALPEMLGGTPADAPPDATEPDPNGRVTGIREREQRRPAPPPAAAPAPTSGLQAPPADVIAAARDAIAKGKSRKAVIARLAEHGYSAEGI